MALDNSSCTAAGLDNYIFPTETEVDWPRALQIVCHLTFLLWLFIGVGLASDAFMNSIEEITSTKKTIRLKNGETKLVDVWNPTVANLSLMALGSSAPEILLSCVELFTSQMVIGPLGSFTIIGSASFNLFVISAVCTAGMPSGQTRLIKETGVFMTTATFSLVAYIWVVAMVSWWTPGVITVEEALITFACFPLMLAVAYGVDKAETGSLNHLSGRLSGLSGKSVFGREINGTRGSKRLMFWRGVTGQGTPAAAEKPPADGETGEDVVEDVRAFSKPNSRRASKDVSEVVDGVTPADGTGRTGTGVPGKTAKVAPQELLSIAPSPASPTGGGDGDGGDGGDDDEEGPSDLLSRIKEAVVGGPPESVAHWALHLFSVIPKIVCAFLPPAEVCRGYPLFVASISMVGVITFFVEESAQAVSCAMGIPPSVAAITLVALGTSLPDTLASRAAALADKTADASVGNITGSNSVNIFLGLGLPWTVGAIYWRAKGHEGMPVPDIGLGYSVTIFEILAVICLAGFGLRRWRFGYELGGRGKYTTAAVFFLLWVTFITLSSLYLIDDFAIF